MEIPAAEDDGVLTEWAPYTNLINQIPLKVQSGLFSQDLSITCIDVSTEYLALGTNIGLVYWYGRQKGDLQRLRCEISSHAITFVKIVSTVDFMVAAGNKNGQVTVFQIPKIHPDNIPEALKPKVAQQVERYTIGDLHRSEITFIEWSKNGMRLFSGDKNGLVVMTEIDFYMHLCKSSEIINETYEIVQISYYQNYLLVSNVYRSIICHRQDSKWDVNQVGKRDRKSLSKLGGIFHFNYDKPNDVTIYSARPGHRIWTSDKQGNVLQTLLFKDAILNPASHVELLNPAQRKTIRSAKELSFGPLFILKEKFIVSYNEDQLYILNPVTLIAVATVDNLRRILSVAVNKEEIFVLEGDRSIVRISFAPDYQIEASDENLMTKSLTNPIKFAVNTIKDLTSTDAHTPFLNMTDQYGQLLNALKETTNNVFGDPNVVTEAEECFEIPPVRELTKDMDTDLISKIMDNIIIDNEGIPSERNDHELREEEIIKTSMGEDINIKKIQPGKPLTEIIYDDDIIYSSKKVKRNSLPNSNMDSILQLNETNSNILNKNMISGYNDIDSKMTRPCLMQMSFCDTKSLLPDNRSPDTIDKDIEDKEELLAKLLNLEPITISNIKPPTPEPPIIKQTDLEIKSNPIELNSGQSHIQTSKVKKLNTNQTKNSKTQILSELIDSPPKVVSIPNVWNLEEIKIKLVTSPAKARPRKKSNGVNDDNFDDWELV